MKKIFKTAYGIITSLYFVIGSCMMWVGAALSVRDWWSYWWIVPTSTMVFFFIVYFKKDYKALSKSTPSGKENTAAGETPSKDGK